MLSSFVCDYRYDAFTTAYRHIFTISVHRISLSLTFYSYASFFSNALLSAATFLHCSTTYSTPTTTFDWLLPFTSSPMKWQLFLLNFSLQLWLTILLCHRSKHIALYSISWYSVSSWSNNDPMPFSFTRLTNFQYHHCENESQQHARTWR